uniref:Attractin and platelet-activating factor acetylhydrolase n=1 Tax=Lutzomyia longipalpis TaxID=7200 RepID=A0A1B0EVE1_LUTLO
MGLALLVKYRQALRSWVVSSSRFLDLMSLFIVDNQVVGGRPGLLRFSFGCSILLTSLRSLRHFYELLYHFISIGVTAVCKTKKRKEKKKNSNLIEFHVFCGPVKMSACVPTPLEDKTGENRWISIHKRFVSELRDKDPEVIFLGDCILEGLQFTEMWNECFAPMHCLNFSIRDDRTENTLWRIHNGVLDNVKPKIVVVHVGTNNVDNAAQEIAEGIVAVVQAIRARLPDAYI